MKQVTEQQKIEMIAAYAAGMPIGAIAKQYGFHRNTIRPIVHAGTAGIQKSQDWRERFNKLPDLCVDAIERSVRDTGDIHKAATTAQTHFKGIGVYGADNQVAINVSNWLNSRPPGCDEIEAMTAREQPECTVIEPAPEAKALAPVSAVPEKNKEGYEAIREALAEGRSIGGL